MYLFRLLILLPVLFFSQPQAATQEYIRDYSYPASRFDSEYTSRIRAIDGVKQKLLNELGTYVASVIEINKDSFGNVHMSNDIKTLTAGILSLIVLQEKWNRVNYYLKAKMHADPDEVLRSVKELQKNHELESALRESFRELTASRNQIRQLKAQLAAHQDNKRPAKESIKLVKSYQKAVASLELENTFQLAMRAYINADYNKMIGLLHKLAKQNYAKAQARLGWIYERGIGVKPNYNEALKLYRQAIQQYDGFAYARLGFMYQRGIGVKQDYQTSIDYLTKSIDMGNGHGHALMGYAHFVSAGVAKDYDESYRHAVIAKDKGNSWGFAWLGRVHEFGLGVDVNYDEALKWYKKSAEKSSPLGLALLGHMYLKGRGVDKDEEKAFKYIKAGADRNNPLAMAMLGVLYEHGIGVEDEDENKAFALYKEAARQGNTFGQMRYARCYWEGIGVDEDRRKGKQLVLEVVKKGMRKARKVHMLMTRDDGWDWYEFFFDENWNPS